MANKKKSKEKVSLLGYDPVETAEEIIDKDNNAERKKAFNDAYKVVMQRFADLFVNPKRKKTSTSGSTGGKAFQNIIVTPEQVKIETNKDIMQEEKREEKERE